jgi:NAD+ synthase
MQSDKISHHIVQWLDNYLATTGLNGFVVGVSGGIDSAVTSCLCAKTKKKVIALNMPIYQKKNQISRSQKHIAWLESRFTNVQGATINLTQTFDQLQSDFPSDIQDGLTMANTRSRLRMLTLYAVASHNKMLVSGTGNKVEDFGVGFYTKYGDGGVDLSPIADLMKSEVYALGKSFGIIEEILTAAPTDGLWEDDRTDESQIGATYAELEWAIAYMASKESKPEPGARQQEVLTIFKKFNQANRHKMVPIPVCIIPEDLL